MMNLQLSLPSRSQLPPAPEAAKELLRRRQARRKLVKFTEYTYPAYQTDRFHDDLGSVLDDVVEGKLTRVIISAPPQHGKSELVSVRLPPFWLAKRPDDPVILTSYGATLAFRHSREARSVLESTEFGALFGRLGSVDEVIETDPENRPADSWRLAGHRGGVLAAGVGGPITGHGAALGIIDDPFEGWRQAYSKTIRDAVWEWWRGTFRPRIWDGGAIVLMMTRWHEDDLVGRLVASQPGSWLVLNYPAVAKEDDRLGRKIGEPLAPHRYGAETLGAIRRDVGEIVWSAEYEGSPLPDSGTLFDTERIAILDAMPDDIIDIVRFYDFAGSSKKTSDYTSGGLLARRRNGRWLICHILRGQWGPGTAEDKFVQTAHVDGKRIRIRIEQEPGSAGIHFIASLVGLLPGWDVAGTPSTGEKTLRARPFAAQVNAGNVDMLRGAWNQDLIDEMTTAPLGANDDQWDSLAGAFNDCTAGEDQDLNTGTVPGFGSRG